MLRKEGETEAAYSENVTKTLAETYAETPEKKLAEILKQPKYPGNSDCDEGKEESVTGISFDTTKRRFDTGAASYFYDLLDVFFDA